MSELVPSNNHATTAARPAALSTRPNALALAKALRRRWLLASICGPICAALAAVGAWSLVPQKYMARTLVHVAPEDNLVMEPRGHRPDAVTHQRDQVSLVKSRLVYNLALKNPKVADLSVVREQADPLDWLDKQLFADFSVAPFSLRIAMVGDRPQELVLLVDALRDAYVKEFFEKDQLDRSEQLVALEQMREKYDRQLRARRKDQEELAKQGISPDAFTREMKLDFEKNRLEWAKRDLGQNEQELRKDSMELSGLVEKEKNRASLEVPDNLLEDSMRNDRAAQPLLAEIDRLSNQIAQGETVYKLGMRHPNVLKLIAERDAKRKALVALRKEASRNELRREIVRLQTKISVSQNERKLLEEDLVRIQDRIQEMQNKNFKQKIYDDDTTVLNTILNRIGTEILARQMVNETPRRLKVLDEGFALPASGMTRVMGSVMAGLGGLGLVFLGISWWEFRARRIGTVEEVIQGLGLKLVGAIPDLSKGWFGRRRRPDDQAQHLFVESIDTTRTMLLEGARAECIHRGDEAVLPQVVMVTSAQAGEGKTSLATHLAASLAQIGHKTLIIDADLRNPTAHRIVGLDREPGFCELLRGEVELVDVVRQTPIEGLWMITGGHWNTKATRALAQPHTALILQQLRADFEFILIDSSPVLPVVDPLLLGRLADIVLLSVLCNVSRMKNVYTACQRLSMVGIRSIRAVMSGVRGEDYDSSYQYFYHNNVKS